MAWIRWHTTASGRRLASVLWRCPGCAKCRSRKTNVHSRALKTAEPRIAELHRQMIEAQQEGRAPPVADVHPREALDRFLAYLRLLKRSPRTIDFYAEKLGGIVDAWEAFPMAAWSRAMLESYIAGRPKWSPRTVQMHLAACRRFIGWAQESGIACPDFVGKLRGPEVRQRERQALTLPQVRAVLDAARGTWVEVAVALAAFCGLSWGDIRALTWAEVDLADGWITRAREKTGVPLRLPIVGALREVLGRHRGLRGVVCRAPDDRHNAIKALKAACRRAGLPKAPRGSGGWHRFRHTYATLAHAAGADLPTVQALMGHRPGSAVTLRYLHSDEGRMRESLERAFGG